MLQAFATLISLVVMAAAIAFIASELRAEWAAISRATGLPMLQRSRRSVRVRRVPVARARMITLSSVGPRAVV